MASLTGKGMFIWKIPRCENGDANAIASVAARLMHPVTNLLVGALFKCIKGKIEVTDATSEDVTQA